MSELPPRGKVYLYDTELLSLPQGSRRRQNRSSNPNAARDLALYCASPGKAATHSTACMSKIPPVATRKIRR